MRFFLRRQSDGAGDSGPMSVTFLAGDFSVEPEYNARPKVGRQIKVGSVYARSYQHQDWWQTSPVTEIVEETPNRVVFKTKNSIYEWIQE